MRIVQVSGVGVKRTVGVVLGTSAVLVLATAALARGFGSDDAGWRYHHPDERQLQLRRTRRAGPARRAVRRVGPGAGGTG